MQSGINGNNIWNGKEITKAVTGPSAKAGSLKSTVSDSLDESLNTKTASSKIAENNGITKAAKTPATTNKNNLNNKQVKATPKSGVL